MHEGQGFVEIGHNQNQNCHVLSHKHHKPGHGGICGETEAHVQSSKTKFLEGHHFDHKADDPKNDGSDRGHEDSTWVSRQ